MCELNVERNKFKINTEQNFVVCILKLTNKDSVNRVINKIIQ